MKRGPKIVKLRRGRVADDSKFIATLVWVLGLARSAKVKGYSIVFVIEEDGIEKTVEAACVPPGEEKIGNALRLLGAMRRMELNFMGRVWGDE